MHRIGRFRRMDAAIDRLVAEHMVDRLQDRRSRAERIGERDRIEFQPGVLELLLQLPPARVEFPRRRALEREDRLLLVADREHGAHHAVARAGAGGEFRDDVRDDVPLPRAGVLRLVDQHMIDAAVELVMHPAGRRRGPASPASCRSDRHSRAGRAPASRAGSSRRPRSRYAAAPRCGRASSRARRRSISGPRRSHLGVEQAGRSAGLLSPKFLVTHRFARRALARSGTRRDIRRPARLPVKHAAPRASRAAWSWSDLLPVSSAAAISSQRDRGRFGPSTISRSTSSMRSSASTPSAADTCAAAASALPASSVQAMK